DMSREKCIAINKAEIFSDFLAHAPRRLIVHTKLPLQFLRRNTVPRSREQIHRIEPLLQWRMRIIERRSNHRMNVVAALAGVSGHLRQLMELANHTASRACDVCAITRFEQMFKASVIVG